MAATMIFGFRCMGMVGLGIGILLSNLFDWLSVWLITAFRYGFRYSRRVWRLFAMQLPMLVAMLNVVRICHGWSYILLGSLCILLSALYSIRFFQCNTDLIRRFVDKLKARR